MSIQLALDTLQQYKTYNKTKELAAIHPFEMTRREAYLDNVIRQLVHYHRRPDKDNMHLVAEDIRHCMLHKYYPDLPNEYSRDGFNFKNTLEDVAQLLDSEDGIIFAA
jgi:hypothetical protein